MSFPFTLPPRLRRMISVSARTSLMLGSWVLVSAVALFSQQTVSVEKKDTPKANSRPTSTPTAPAEPFEKADVKLMASKCVTLETEAGSIDIELYPESAPETVRNFLNLVAIGAFETTTFSRVVPGFVIQGGNIATREAGWTPELIKRAKHTILDEPNKILHERGIVSMARTDEPNAATTHYFILVDSTPSLDGKFAAFGKVIKGMDVVDGINKAPVENENPAKAIRVKRAVVNNCNPGQS